jgi:glucokinase
MNRLCSRALSHSLGISFVAQGSGKHIHFVKNLKNLNTYKGVQSIDVEGEYMRRYAIGVDVGGTNCRAALGDEKGNIVDKLAEKVDKTSGQTGISRQISAMITALLEKNAAVKVEGIGIGSLGPLDLKRGIIIEAANLPDLQNVPLVEPVEKQFGVPVRLLNDCSAAVVGEKYYGEGKEVNNLVYVTISSGIGVGVIVDGHLLFGKDGNVSELGHQTIDSTDSRRCACGRLGHWEAYCSGRDIPAYVRELIRNDKRAGESLLLKLAGHPDNLTAKLLYESAKQQDELSSEIIERLGRLNAIGFANIINAYDPSLITVGGSVALNNPKLIIEPIKKYVADYAINRLPEIKITSLGGDIVLYGAIATVFQHENIFPATSFLGM